MSANPREQDILAVSARLFAQNGYPGTAMSQLAMAALSLGLAMHGVRADTVDAKVLKSFAETMPHVRWIKDSAKVVHFRRADQADIALLGYDEAGGVLAIARGRNLGARPKVFRFAISPSVQLAVCERPIGLEVLPATCERDTGPLEGCQVARGTQELVVVGGDCDPLHVYWNSKTRELNWWRL